MRSNEAVTESIRTGWGKYRGGDMDSGELLPEPELNPPVGVTSVRDLEDAVAAVEQSVSDLLIHDDGTWARADRVTRLELYRRLERVRNRLALVDTRFLDAVEATGDITPRRRQRPTWFARTVGIPRREAQERLAAATRLSPGHDPWALDPSATGPDHMPAITEAVDEGIIGTATVAKLDKQLREMPETVQTALTASADAPVAALLRETDPDIIGKVRPYLLQLTGTDDPYTEADRRRLRGVTIGAQGPDGMSRLSGYLTPEAATVMTRLFADHANAGSLNGGAQDIADARDDRADISDSAGDGDSTAGNEPDPRTPAQRRHDALFAAVNAGYDPSGELRPRRGATTIVAAMTLDQLLARTGTVTTDAGTSVDVGTLVEQTDVQDVFLQVMDFRGQTLYLGRSARNASLAQYLALVGEEGVSSAPGSSVAPALTDVHHIVAWSRNGPTDIDNLTLVDRSNHRTIDDSKTNDERWQTHPAPAGSMERLDWVPPVKQDPDREPRSNPHPMVWNNPGQSLRRRARERGWHRTQGTEGTERFPDRQLWYRATPPDTGSGPPTDPPLSPPSPHPETDPPP
jgi:hypothetical protein